MAERLKFREELVEFYGKKNRKPTTEELVKHLQKILVNNFIFDGVDKENVEGVDGIEKSFLHGMGIYTFYLNISAQSDIKIKISVDERLFYVKYKVYYGENILLRSRGLIDLNNFDIEYIKIFNILPQN